jgi:deoxyribodipyrimidine photo-lyase
MQKKYAAFWFRRDLRLRDNRGLYKALISGLEVLPVFIFDKEILDKLEDPNDKRISFLHDTIVDLKQQLQEFGSDLFVHYGNPLEVWAALIEAYPISKVFLNRDYEPYAQKRDREVFELLAKNNIEMLGSKDSVVFEKDEVVKDDGKPYTVFTPYSRKWLARLTPADLEEAPSISNVNTFAAVQAKEIPTLREMNFKKSEYDAGNTVPKVEVIEGYHNTRDIPSLPGTSRISVMLRFGLLSIRQAARIGKIHSHKWLTELIWRDFYQAILYHFPHSANNSFKPEYDAIPWEKNEAHFDAWCEGKTGYPLVDAGMRELAATGFMHNRVRMVTASFFTKHLLLDWRLGEAWFAAKLMDYEMASNIGGWQWAASSGCDAAPYFRVFNPELQFQKFDKDLLYVRKWVPEYGTPAYPKPIVAHKFARDRAISRYKEALAKAKSF